jgi:hypothetical protein
MNRQRALWGLAACGFVALLLLVRLSAFGIWDPWELGTADAARKLAAGQSADAIGASTWLVSQGFRIFGVHEWAGRLPIALSGIITALLAFALCSRVADPRTGIYAALITATSPLFVFTARAMLGDAPGFAVQAALALCAIRALSPLEAAERARDRASWGLGALLALSLAVLVRGGLLGALPPLLAAVVVAWLLRPAERPRVILGVASVVALGLVYLVVRDVLRDSGTPSLWLGGRALSGEPPTFDAVLEDVFHAFAPWSALLPQALGRLWQESARVFVPPTAAPAVAAPTELSSVAILWAAGGYAAQTLFMSRYGGEIAFLPVVGLSVLVALFLRDLERQRAAFYGLALAALFLTGLILRDYALYPSGPMSSMPLASFEVPSVFNPKRTWSLLLCAFGLCAFLGLGVAPDREQRLGLAAPYRFVRAQWRRGSAVRIWLLVLAALVLGGVVLGVLAYAVPGALRMPTIALRWVRRLVFLPLLLAAAVALAQLALWGFAKLGTLRFVPLLAAGAAIGVYVSQGYLPALSEHFSPREVYATYNALSHGKEALGEFNVGGRAAAYYAKGPVIELTAMARLIDHLATPERRWAAFPAQELPEVDRSFRQRTKQHLFVADARNARIVLVSNRAIEGRRDENFLAKVVLSQPPAKIDHRISINFEKKIELLGYDLDLPHDGYVGAGESFKLTWYFRALTSGPSGYKVFVHIDGQGQRIHGDHEPINGQYPLKLWNAGDVIVDEQKFDVPASYRRGNYTIYMGFYSGDTRLTVESGPSDGANRATVGVLRIQ